MSLAPDQLETLRGALAEHLGLELQERQVDALGRHLRSARADEAARIVRGEPAALRALASALTVGESYFLRSPEQLHYALERASASLSRGAPFRLLSAGCSLGQEPYSLAILAEERFAARELELLTIDAVDLNPASVDRARAGLYSAWNHRRTPAALAERYFRREGERQRLLERIRRRVSFSAANLNDPLDPLWSGAPYEAVFCRNVLMYFTPQRRAEVIARFARLIPVGGLLFLGSSETLRQVPCDAFEVELHDDPPRVAYRRVDPGSAAGCAGGSREETRVSRRPAGRSPRARSGSSSRPRQSARARRLNREAAASAASARSPAQPRASAKEASAEEASAEEATSLVAAAEALEASDFSRARAIVEELTEPAASSADAYYLRAILAEVEGDLVAARDLVRKTLFLDPSLVVAHLLAGRLAYAEGRSDDARRAFRNGLARLSEREDEPRLAGDTSRASLASLCRAELSRLERGGVS